MYKIIASLITVLFWFELSGQTDPCKLYRDRIASGKAAFNGRNYEQAIKDYLTAQTAAMQCPTVYNNTSQKELPGEKLNEIFKAIRNQRDIAVKAKDSIDKLLKEVTTQKNIADSALAKAERFINALDFYADNFALAYKNGKVGYINKKGETVIAYRYETAGAFDYTGFAKVHDIQEFGIPNPPIGGPKTEYRPIAYLIDTNDTQFRVAYQVNELEEKEETTGVEKFDAVDLRNTPLLSFPPHIKLHPQLQVLILDGKFNKENNLKNITGELSFFTNLKHLYLQYCRLDSLPADIDKIDSLQSLGLRGNNIHRLPPTFTNLKELQTLNLIENELDSLPHDIGKLKKLKILLLTDNHLSVLPAGFRDLTSLEVLSLRKNNLPQWSTSLENLSDLRQFNYSDNNLRTFPQGLLKLKKLEVLDLSFNQNINAVPQGINQLKALRKLSLVATKIAELPNSFQELANLLELELRGTEIENFPAQILQLKNLQILDLSFNKKLKIIPEKIKELKNLRVLRLNNCDIPDRDHKKIRSWLPSCNIIFMQRQQ
jgi:Leucine-rich repeat (LRR) protein